MIDKPPLGGGRLSALATTLRAPADDAARSSASRELGEVARGHRSALVAGIEAHLGPFDPRQLQAVLEVPREIFVRPEDVERSVEDVPLPLDEAGFSTISAPHAYLLSFRLLELAPGDSVVELGSGTGYGAALAATIVGHEGEVLTFEIDASLAQRASQLLRGWPNVSVVRADATKSAPRWFGATKVVCTFAVESIPVAWLEALGRDGYLVAPVGPRERDQRLLRVVRQGHAFVTTDHGAVRYVSNRAN